jgi:uncharacterized repeat protein (TIGR03943 family)
MLALGAVLVRLLWSGGFGWFVQQRMWLPLVGAAIVLVVFGAYEVGSAAREEEADPEALRRSAGPGVGWLLLLPLVVLISVAPTGLGAAAADRVDAYTPTETTDQFDPLDTSNGPPELRVYDFLERAAWDEQRSLEDQVVRLEGLVINDPDVPDGFKLTRFMVSCCAADGIPLQVTLHGTDEPLADETWVVADVIWRPPSVPYPEQGPDSVIEADAVSVTVVPDAPNDPYESPY